MKNILNAIFNFRKNRDRITIRVSLVRAWHIEITLGMVVLILLLGFDYWVYQKIVVAEITVSQEAIDDIAVLDKKNIQDSASLVADHETKLNTKTIPLISDPF